MEKKNGYVPLFETKLAKGRLLFRLHAVSIFVSICMVFVYRLKYFPFSEGLEKVWLWTGLFLSEICFGFFWFLTAVIRWKPIRRYTYKDRLALRFLFIFQLQFLHQGFCFRIEFVSETIMMCAGMEKICQELTYLYAQQIQ